MSVRSIMTIMSSNGRTRPILFILASLVAYAAGVDDTLSFYTPTPVHSLPTYIPSTAHSTSTSTSSSSVSLAFGEMGNATVCGQQNITWFYSGDQSYTLNLAVLGLGGKSTTTQVLKTMSGGLNMKTTFDWETVAVPAGQYAIQISVPEALETFTSQAFYVIDSKDHSCLSASSQTQTSSSSQSSTRGSASTTDSADDGATGIPAVGAVSGASKMSSGGITGVVIGSLALVVGLLVALMLFRRCRRSSGGAPRGGLFEKRRPKGAISISSRNGSFSSAHGGAAAAAAAPGRTGAGTTYTLNDDGPGAPAEKRQQGSPPSGFGVVIPKATHRSPFEHRSSFGSQASGSTSVTSPTQSQHQHRPSRQSSLLYSIDPFSSAPPSRRQSEDQVPVALYAPYPNAPTPRSVNFPSFPQDVSIVSSTAPDFSRIGTDGVSPPANAILAGRERGSVSPQESTSTSSSQPAPLPRRKSGPARKPVPTYSPSVSNEEMELTEPTSPRSYSLSAAAGSDAAGVHSHYRGSMGGNSRSSFVPSSLAGNDWSSAAAHSHSPVSGLGASPASSRSYLPYSAHASSAISEYGVYNLPELNHKSSFGERQMHVIMPDPPSREMQ